MNRSPAPSDFSFPFLCWRPGRFPGLDALQLVISSRNYFISMVTAFVCVYATLQPRSVHLIRISTVQNGAILGKGYRQRASVYKRRVWNVWMEMGTRFRDIDVMIRRKRKRGRQREAALYTPLFIPGKVLLAARWRSSKEQIRTAHGRPEIVTDPGTLYPSFPS